MTAQRCLQPPLGAAAAAAGAHRAALPSIATARLVLRAPRPGDCALWTRIWCGTDQADAITPEHAWEEFCVYTAGWLLHGHGLWTIERSADAALLGFVLVGLEWDDVEPELGWALAPEHRGVGYGTEAATAARDHAVALFGPGGAVSYVDPANRRSALLAARLGACRDAAAEAALGDGTQVWRHGAPA